MLRIAQSTCCGEREWHETNTTKTRSRTTDVTVREGERRGSDGVHQPETMKCGVLCPVLIWTLSYCIEVVLKIDPKCATSTRVSRKAGGARHIHA